MKKFTKIKALLFVLALTFTFSGVMSACTPNNENSSDSSLGAESSESTNDSSENSESSESSDSSTGEEQAETFSVHFETMQQGYKVQTGEYEATETVSLPTCQDKVIGPYTCPFLYWADCETDVAVTESFAMPEENVYLYAVYDNGMVSGDIDFSLTAEGYVAVDTTSQGALKNLSMANDGDVYSLGLTLPAVSSDYKSEAGLTFAAKSYQNNAFASYLQLFIVNANSAKAGSLYLYLIEPNKTDATKSYSALVKEVTMASLEGTAYYTKFNAWLQSDEEETFTYSVRLNKTEKKWYIGVDGEELTSLAVGDTANGYTITDAYLSQSTIGFRSKCVDVKLAQPKVVNINDYTVTLDANGGTFTGGATQQTVKISEYNYANLPTPTKDGYNLRGWYGYDTYGEKIELSATSFAKNTLLDLNATYYAVWTDSNIPTYTLAIDTGVSGYTVDGIAYYQVGDEVTLPTLTHNDYRFDSVLYYDDARTQAIDFANFDISKAAVNGTTITVYAKASFLFDGEGTSTSPYQIKTADDLKLFAQKVNAGQTYAGKYFVLTGNIDVGAGTAWTPINVGFAGTLDGGNYTVSNVNINTTERKTGFFVELNAGTIKNLKLNVTITSTNEVVGGLVGSTTGDVTIENCEISGSITALKSVGGIVAYVGGNITIKNCINNASITLTNTGAATNVFTGGVIGATVDNTKTVFDGCVNKGNVQGTGLYIGGVAGLLRAGSTGSEIKNSYNYGNVITGANSGWVAGVVGCNRIAMTDCYCLNTATISVGTSSQAASAYAASSSAKTTIGYLACTSTGIVATGGGLCDENGDPVQ